MKHARDISNFSLGEIGKYSLQYKNIHTKFLFCFAFASKAKINSSSGFGHFPSISLWASNVRETVSKTLQTQNALAEAKGCVNQPFWTLED